MKKKKIRIIKKHAKRGNPQAMYQLALCYEMGIGILENIEMACVWMQEAANYGHSGAIEWLEDYYFDDDSYVQAYA